MPEDKYSFKPTAGKFDGVMDFAGQVKHLAGGIACMQPRFWREATCGAGKSEDQSRDRSVSEETASTYAHKAARQPQRSEHVHADPAAVRKEPDDASSR